MTLSQVLLLGSVALAASQSFSYDRCDTAKGPSNWSGQCKNQQFGTPIDLCGAKAFPNGLPSFTLNNWDKSRSVTMVNNAKTVQINIAQDASTPTTKTDKSLSRLVNRTSDTTDFTWVLAQMHPHWGRKDRVNEGSEHYLNGRAYPFEAHFVHYNSKYPTIGAAVGSGNADALLVVGVFFELGTTDLPAMTTMANAISSLTKTDKALASNIKLSEIFDGTGDFYSYGGGLTTPGCNEIVTWIVMTTPKVMTRSTLEKYWAASGTPPESVAYGTKFQVQAGATIGEYGNFRPLVPLGNRNLYSTMGATAACTSTATDVQWGTCQTQQDVKGTNAGSMMQPSALVSILAASLAYLMSRQ